MTYRDRREAKAERLRGWAAKREQRSAADLERARAMTDAIPFGQPILAGHHSENRDRRYRDRAWATMGRGVESARMAERMNSRADGIDRQNERAIYSDDPDAVEALEARLADLEAEREAIKAENAAFRKAHRAELKTLSPYQRDQAMPHRGYVLSNLTGNIKRNKDRLIVVRRQHERSARAQAGGGVDVVDHGNGYTSVTFAEKPDRDTLDALKAAGYRWSAGSWVGRTEPLPEGITP